MKPTAKVIEVAPLIRRISPLPAVMGLVAGLVVLMLVLYVTANVTSRYIIGAPLPGTVEIVAYVMMPAISCFGWAYAAVRGDHVKASLVTDALPATIASRVETVWRILTGMCLSVFAAFTLAGAVEALQRNKHTVGASIEMPTWPMMFLVPAGLIGYLIAVSIRPQTNDEGSMNSGATDE